MSAYALSNHRIPNLSDQVLSEQRGSYMHVHVFSEYIGSNMKCSYISKI